MEENNFEKVFFFFLSGVGVLGVIAMLVLMILKSTNPLEISLVSVLSLSLVGYLSLSTLYHFVENDVIEKIAWGFLYLSVLLLISNYTFLKPLSLKGVIPFGVCTFLGIIGIVFNALNKDDFKVANIILLFVISLALFLFLPLNYFLGFIALNIISLVLYFISVPYMHSMSHLFNMISLLGSYALIYFYLI